MNEATARAANQYRSQVGQDLCLAAELADFEVEREAAPYEPVDVELMPRGERQTLNLAMSDWFNG